MADLSNSSDMMALEGLSEELVKHIRIYMLPHCYRVTEKGVIMMKIFAIDELRMYDLPKHSKSTASFINGLLNFVDDLIDKKKSVDPIPVIQKSAIEELANNPCKDLSICDVAGQDTIQPSQAKLSNQISLASTQKLILVLLRSGATKQRQRRRLYRNRSDCFSNGSNRLSQGFAKNQSQRWLNPRNPRLVFGKLLNPKAVISMKRKSRSQV